MVYDPYLDTFLLVYLVQEDSPRLSRIVTVAIPNGEAIVSVAALLRFAGRLLEARTGGVVAVFPSPSAGGVPRPEREQ